MILITTFLWIVCLILNFIVGKQYNDLYRKQIIHTDNRVSFKILKEAIEHVKNKEELEVVLKCRNYYRIYIFLFYVALSFILITIIINT